MARPDREVANQVSKEIAPSSPTRHSTSVSTNTLSHSDVAGGRGLVGRKPKKEIKAILYLPDDAKSLTSFEEKIRAFYITQIEKRLQPLQKVQRMEVLQELIDNYNVKSNAS